MKATVKKKILLHLLEYFRENHSGKPSYHTSQKGITNAVDASRGYVSRTLSQMSDEDLIDEKMEDVGVDQKRKVKVYSLTSKGQEKAELIQKKFLEKEIFIKKLDEKKKIKVKELENYVPNRDPVLSAILNVNKEGILDITEYEKLDRTTFIDRKKELSKLNEDLEYVIDENCRVIFISGMAGSGKTELCLEFKRRLEEKDVYFFTGKAQVETSKPFSLFKNAFKDFEDKGIDLDFKNLGEVIIETDDYDYFHDRKTAYFHRISDQIRRTSCKKPIVIFLDDLQSSDVATIELLRFLVMDLEDAPVLFLCTYRPEEIPDDHLLKDIKNELLKTENCKNIVLKNFDLDQSRQFLQELTERSRLPLKFVKLLYHLTQGNPLFLKEFVKLLIEEEKIPPHSSSYPTKEKELKIPETLKNVIKERLESHLSEKARNVVEYGCILGDPISLELLSKVIEIDYIDLLKSIEELLDKNILIEGSTDDTFYFSHELISKVAYEKIPSWKKKRIHLLVSEKIEESFRENIEKHYFELAHHYERGEKITTAVDYYIKAGEESEMVFAHENAIDMYKKAFNLTEENSENVVDRCDIVKRIGRAYSLLGRFERSREYLAKAVKLTDEKKEKKEIYSKIANTFFIQGKFDKALNYIEDSFELEEKNDDITCKLFSLKGWIHVRKDNLDEAERTFKKEKRLAERCGSDKEKGRVYHDLGTVYLGKKENDLAIQKFKRAIKIKERIDDKIGLNRSYNNLALAYRYKGEQDKAEKYFKKSLEVCEEAEYKVGLFDILSNFGYYLFNKGKIERSRELFRRSYKIADELKDKRRKKVSFSNLSDLFLTNGDLERSKEYLRKCKEIENGTTGSNNLQLKIIFLDSRLKKKEGKLKEAKGRLLETKRLAKSKGDDWGLGQTYTRLGEIYTLQGVFEKGKECYEKAKGYGNKSGYKNIISSSKEGLAEIEMMVGREEKAKKLFDDGLNIAEELENDELIIRNLSGLGEYHLKMNDIGSAEKCLLRASKKIEKREEPKLRIQYYISKTRLHRKKDDLTSAKTYLESALEESDKSNDKIWKAKTIFEFGVFYAAKGEENKSEKHLKDSLDMFDEMGMRWWKKKAKRSLSKVEQGSNFHDLA